MIRARCKLPSDAPDEPYDIRHIELAACPRVGEYLLMDGEEGRALHVRRVIHNPRTNGSTFDVRLDID